MADVGSVARLSAPNLRRRGLLMVFAAGALYSSAGLFTRVLHCDPWTILAWRSLFGAFYMVVLVAIETGRVSLRDYALSGPRLVLVPLTAIATSCYVLAFEFTTVADVMIVYATMPFVTAAVAWVWAGEVPSRRTILASIAALAGVAIMIGGGGPVSPNRLLGASLVLFMNVVFAMSIVLAGREPERSMTPVNTLGVLMAASVGFWLAPHSGVSLQTVGISAVYGVLTIGLALSLFMAGARILPSVEVSLIGISDVVLGPALVWLAFGEDPGRPAILGGSVVTMALLWNLWPEVMRLFPFGRHRASRWN